MQEATLELSRPSSTSTDLLGATVIDDLTAALPITGMDQMDTSEDKTTNSGLPVRANGITVWISGEIIEPIGVPRPTTYAEATNLASCYPSLASYILALPMPPPIHQTESYMLQAPSAFEVPVVPVHSNSLSAKGPAHTSSTPNWALAPDDPCNDMRSPRQRGDRPRRGTKKSTRGRPMNDSSKKRRKTKPRATDPSAGPGTTSGSQPWQAYEIRNTVVPLSMNDQSQGDLQPEASPAAEAVVVELMQVMKLDAQRGQCSPGHMLRPSLLLEAVCKDDMADETAEVGEKRARANTEEVDALVEALQRDRRKIAKLKEAENKSLKRAVNRVIPKQPTSIVIDANNADFSFASQPTTLDNGGASRSPSHGITCSKFRSGRSTDINMLVPASSSLPKLSQIADESEWHQRMQRTSHKALQTSVQLQDNAEPHGGGKRARRQNHTPSPNQAPQGSWRSRQPSGGQPKHWNTSQNSGDRSWGQRKRSGSVMDRGKQDWSTPTKAGGPNGAPIPGKGVLEVALETPPSNTSSVHQICVDYLKAGQSSVKTSSGTPLDAKASLFSVGELQVTGTP